MAAKSPTSIRTREIIGGDQFCARREVFDKHDTVFLPPSPTLHVPKEMASDGTMNNFKRNGPTYSSMRESRTEGRDIIEFRPRKYSDNFTSDLNQSDDFDYRRSMTERTRRLSKLRRDFLNSNLHEPTSDSSFSRTGVRASMPARSAAGVYKIESPNLYKFPFAEPYATPPPVRRVLVDLDDSSTSEGKDKENRDPAVHHKHTSLPNGDTKTTKLDHQKLFQELVKRYSPQRKPIDWTLPPTKPRVIGAVPKSSTTESLDSGLGRNEVRSDEDVFVKKRGDKEDKTDSGESSQNTSAGADKLDVNDSKVSLSELEEKNDRVAELSVVQRQMSRESPVKRTNIDKNDLNIPKLIEKMNAEGEALESHSKSDKQKVKRKRSFLDKLLGRRKGEKNK